ncbi:hypothetical protein J2T17_004682 [Paenibacillus mucilaginosus]|uniref:hypothetical protein n=1 Tax=Paenibacillus mucilaginosus TaxID=61624 RepID=UPI003D1ED294
MKNTKITVLAEKKRAAAGTQALVMRRFDDEESVSYYTADMLANNMMIEERVVYGEESGDIQTYIAVKHFNEQDAGEWIMYWDDSLAPIQAYRIVMDIYELYLLYPVDRFMQVVNDLSISNFTAAMQSIPKNRVEIMDGIRADIERLK